MAKRQRWLTVRGSPAPRPPLLSGLSRPARAGPEIQDPAANAARVAAVGAPLPVLAVAGWLPAAILLAGLFGAGTVVAEVVGDTCLQRTLDPTVFARAYGLALPANLAGIAAGALLAPIGVAILGVDGTLVALGAAVIAYRVLLVDRPRGLRSAHTTLAGVE